jgi:carbon starvation protein CstA
MVFLWTVSVYLVKRNKAPWITLIPALFMTAVVSSYILIAPEGLALPKNTGYFLGVLITVATGTWFFIYQARHLKSAASDEMKVVPEAIGVVDEKFKRQKDEK